MTIRIWTPLGVALAALLVTLLLPGAAPAAGTERFPGPEWERADAEAQGWSSEKLESALEMARDLGSSALLVVHRGVIVAELGKIDERFNVRSIRKPLLGALYARQIEEGRIRLDATLAELGVDEKGGLTEVEKTATLADLLTSRSGIYLEAAWEHPEHARNRPDRGSHAPGTHFYYNNWDFNALGTIYQEVSGQELFAAFETEIADPLGMQDFRPEDGEYESDRASLHPAYKFHLSARDLARVGLLYLREGRWDDEQLIPASWVRESTRTHVEDVNPFSSYGYLWRTYPKYGTHYAATGAGSQMLVVAPDLDLVVVHFKKTWFGRGGVPRERFWQLFGMVAAAAP